LFHAVGRTDGHK